VELEGLVQAIDQSPGHLLTDPVAGHVFDQDGELVTAEAGDGVLGSNRAGQAAGDLDEQLISTL
jgi:hypothetical protein